MCFKDEGALISYMDILYGSTVTRLNVHSSAPLSIDRYMLECRSGRTSEQAREVNILRFRYSSRFTLKQPPPPHRATAATAAAEFGRGRRGGEFIDISRSAVAQMQMLHLARQFSRCTRVVNLDYLSTCVSKTNHK